MNTSTLNAYVYEVKKFKYLEQWNIEKLQLKVYTITKSNLPDDYIPPTAAAHKYIINHLPKAADHESNSHDLGFVIIHYCQGHIWLLIHWWAHDDICCQLMAYSQEKNIEFTSTDHRPIHACIWENKIINHENQAWIDSMLSSYPNHENYLNQRFEDGNY